MTDSRLTILAIPGARATDVFITRAFAAPRAIVWRFFTEPELLAQWFGPTEVPVDPSTVRVDLHPGGRCDVDMVDNKTGDHYRVPVPRVLGGEREMLGHPLAMVVAEKAVAMLTAKCR